MPGVMRLRTTLALLAPVLLVGCMMLFELAHLGLSIYSADAALDRTLARWASEPHTAPGLQALPRRLGDHMSEALHGRLPASAITVQAREFGRQEGARPRSLTVDVYQIYVTPLPALFGLGDGYRYRYKRFIGHPALAYARQAQAWVPCCLLSHDHGPAVWPPYLLSAAWAAGVAALGALAWHLGVGSGPVALVFAALVALTGAQAGAFVVVTAVAGGLLALLRLPYAWALLLGLMWWVAQ